jgi:hypothetical protein
MLPPWLETAPDVYRSLPTQANSSNTVSPLALLRSSPARAESSIRPTARRRARTFSGKVPRTKYARESDSRAYFLAHDMRRGCEPADDCRSLVDEFVVLERLHHEQGEVHAAREVALKDGVADVAAPDR